MKALRRVACFFGMHRKVYTRRRAPSVGGQWHDALVCSTCRKPLSFVPWWWEDGVA